MRPEVRSGLGDEVAQALEALGVEVVDVLGITGLPEPGLRRTTHRITLADGRTFKVRRVSRPENATRMYELLRKLADPHFPPPFWVSGRVVLEPWVEGTPLSELPMTEQRMTAAAEVLSRLHRLPRFGRRRLPEPARPRGALVRAKQQVAWLAATALISPRGAASLNRILVRSAPPTAFRGLIHQDFCASNLVEDAEHRIVVVDNAGMCFGFLDYDLARTWCRWPMSASAWDTFLSDYLRASGRRVPAESWPFWQVCAVAKSAAFRLARGTGDLDAPLSVLRGLIREE